MIVSRISPIVLFCAALVSAQSKAPDYSWAFSSGGPSDDYARAVAVDSLGNIYVTGSFSASMTLKSQTIVSAGSDDIFLAKLSSAGQLQWLRQFGSTGSDRAYDVQCDASGNAILTGWFSGRTTFGGTDLNAIAGADGFVAKIDPAGTVLWANQFGGPMTEDGNSLAVDPRGNIYIAGNTTAGAVTVGSIVLSPSGGGDGFLIKYSPEGNLNWAKPFAATGDDIMHNIAVDPAGNISITGEFQGTLTAGSTKLQSAGQSDAYLARFDTNGTLLWAQAFGSSGIDIGRGTQSDGLGNTYFSGEFSGTLSLGATPLTSPGPTGVYLAKASPEGKILWATAIGGSASTKGCELSLGPDGALFATGEFAGVAQIGTSQLHSAGGFDLFTVKLDPNGTIGWVTQAGGAGNEINYAVAASASGSVIAVGTVTGTSSFGSIATSAFGGMDLYVANLSAPPTAVASTSFTVVSAASYLPDLAPGSIAALFGSGFDSTSRLTFTDAAGTSRNAQIYSISPAQINFLLPADASTGAGTLSIDAAPGPAKVPVALTVVAPALFSADGSGSGVPAAQIVTTLSNGMQTFANTFTSGPEGLAAIPVSLGNPADRVSLVLFGTGIQNRSSLSAVSVTIGAQTLPAAYAGPQGNTPGLDQVNVDLPKTLSGAETVSISVQVNGMASNSLNLLFREPSSCGSGVPIAPSGVFVNTGPDPAATGKQSVAYVSWTANSGGSSATSYTVQLQIPGQPAILKQITAPANSVTVSGLPLGTQNAPSVSVSVQATGTPGCNSTFSGAVQSALPSPPTAAQSQAYASALAYSDAQQGEAVIVYKDGQVVFEQYSHGYDGNASHALASGTKSFNMAFELLAEADGYLKLTDRASATFPEWNDGTNRAAVTLLDLLSLQGGLAANPAYSATKVATLDTYQLGVMRNSEYAPEQVFIYDPLAFQNFAEIFQVRTGGKYMAGGAVTGGTDPLAYLQQKLFTPLGVTLSPSDWQRDAAGHPQMAGGANLNARNWLKYGQLVLQQGTWQTARLLDAGKIQYFTSGYVNPSYGGYGITWWLNHHNNGTYDPKLDQVPVDGQPTPGSDQIAPHVPVDMFMAAGTGKERLYIIPSLNLAVVRFAPLNSGGAGSTWSDDTFLGKLIGTLP